MLKKLRIDERAHFELRGIAKGYFRLWGKERKGEKEKTWIRIFSPDNQKMRLLVKIKNETFSERKSWHGFESNGGGD